jgi:tetratricopeptide (TPR) repeat protein
MVKRLLSLGAILLALYFGSGNKKVFSEEVKNSGLEIKLESPAHTYLNIEKDCGTVKSDYKILEEIIEKSQSKISQIQKEIGLVKLSKNYSSEEIVRIFNGIHSTLKELGFSFKEIDLLNQGLKSKNLDCDTYAVIYKTIGDILGLPIYMVRAPNHAFVRWDANGKHDALNRDHKVNKGDVNWETTDGWSSVNDDEYISRLKIPLKSIKEGTYLQNLNYNEILSIGYANKGSYYIGKEEYKKALINFEKSIELSPFSEISIRTKELIVKKLEKLLELIDRKKD